MPLYITYATGVGLKYYDPARQPLNLNFWALVLLLSNHLKCHFILFFFGRKVNRNFLTLLPIYKSDVTTDFKVYFYGLLITFFDFGHKNMIGRYLIGI